MKTINIIILIVISIVIAIFAGAYGDSSTYTDFGTARNNRGKEYHIVGKLVKSKPMVYNPLLDANRFEFYLTDSLGNEAKVIYSEPKPTDFDRSDKVVVIGKFNDSGDDFIASKILLKCPSKYEAEMATE
ncbi:MAG: cytochrome c maturation protein CcmE [Flavobacteriales bacterium]|nr:cytochrome c maturation protein CcmE [Flavobacteriales bacterium]